MAISKGFLRGQGFKPDKYLIFSWLIYMLIMSTLLHLLFVYFGEGLIVTTTSFLFAYPIEINTETKFYSYFLAGLATVTAFGLSSNLILRTAERLSGSRVKLNFRLSQTYIGFNTWCTIYVVTKAFALLMLLFIPMSNRSYLNLGQEFGYVFYLLVVVMFLNNWLESHRILKGNYLKYLAISSLTVTVITFSLAKIHPVSFKELNEEINDNSFLVKYDFHLPKVSSYLRLDRPRGNKTFFFVAGKNPKLPMIFQLVWKDLVQINNDSIPAIFSNTSSFGYQQYDLYINDDVSLSQVENVLNQIQVGRYIGVNYKVASKDSREFAYEPFWRSRTSITEGRNGGCQIEMDIIKNLKETKVNPKRIKWPEENPCYRLIDYKNYNRVLIEVEKDQLLLNGQEVDNETLREVILSLFQKHRDRSLILFKPSPEISFGQYLTTLDEVRSTIIELREAYAMLEYGFDYDFHYRHYARNQESEMIKDIEDQFPMHIILLKGWDLELYNYLKE